jgi:hypothetical protein
MARLFNDASTEYLIRTATPPVTGYPYVMACWARSDSATLGQTLLFVGDKDATDKYTALYLRGDVAGDPVRALVHTHGAPISAATADTSSGYSANTWHHCCGTYTDTGIYSYIDGGSKGSDLTQIPTPAGWDRTSLAYLTDSTPALPLSGNIAEAAIWDLSNWSGATQGLKAANFQANALPGLAAGYSPLFWPLGLKAYWPLGGIYGVNSANAANGDMDHVGGFHLDPQNTPGTSDHPRIIYPNSGLLLPAVTGAAPANALLPKLQAEGLYVGMPT